MINKNNIFAIITLFSVLFILAALKPDTASAGPYDIFTIKLDPKYPGANMDVKAELVAYSFDKDASLITWTYNGKIIAQGRGKKTATFRTGDIGSTVNLSIFIVTETGTQLENKVSFKISEVDLLWQASSYTPGYYKGKALATAYSPIKVTAVPHSMGPVQNLIFKWKKDGKTIESGLGQNSFIFTATDSLLEQEITAEVSTLDRNYTIVKTVNIGIKQPEILFYAEHPSEGLFTAEALVNQFSMRDKEIVIKAEPYFFPRPYLSSLKYEWKMNDGIIQPISQSPNYIGFQKTGEESGSSLIQLYIQNPQKILQKAMANIKFNF